MHPPIRQVLRASICVLLASAFGCGGDDSGGGESSVTSSTGSGGSSSGGSGGSSSGGSGGNAGSTSGEAGAGGTRLTSLCDTPDERIDPSAAMSMSNADFVALGAGRTGSRGVGTAQDNDAVRYVSAEGGDDAGEGTLDDPWRTLQHAADTAGPGTTVLVDDSGTYSGGIEISRGGKPGRYLIFQAADPEAMPRIAGGGDYDAVVRISASYVVFEGFEIADHQRDSLADDTIGIAVETDGQDVSHVEIRNNRVHDIGPGVIEQDSCYYNGHGIIAQSEGSLISQLIIDGNELFDLYVGNSEVLVVNGNIADFCVTSNFVHDVNNIAIDIIGYEQNAKETTEHGTISDNVVLDASNYWPYCSRGNCTYPEADESSDGIYVDGGADLDISYNVVGRTDHGIELQSENGELIRNVEVHDNVVFNSNYRNFTLGDSEDSREFDNVFFDDPALADDRLEGCK